MWLLKTLSAGDPSGHDVSSANDIGWKRRKRELDPRCSPTPSDIPATLGVSVRADQVLRSHSRKTDRSSAPLLILRADPHIARCAARSQRCAATVEAIQWRKPGPRGRAVSGKEPGSATLQWMRSFELSVTAAMAEWNVRWRSAPPQCRGLSPSSVLTGNKTIDAVR